MQHPQRQHHQQNSSKISRRLWDKSRETNASNLSLLRAILYECQPIRFSSLKSSGPIVTRQVFWFLVGLFQSSPKALSKTVALIRSTPLRIWAVFGCIAIYFYIVYYLHILLDAGPMVLIVTALIAIFSIGLGDAVHDSDSSAYSVFNRGCRAIMGTVDAEALVAQHVGGAMAGAGLGRRLDDTEQRIDQHDAAHMQQHHNAQDQHVVQPRSRKSNKKNRRGNLEERVDRRRQREMAMQMGFTGDGNDGEARAMNHLLDDENNIEVPDDNDDNFEVLR